MQSLGSKKFGLEVRDWNKRIELTGLKASPISNNSNNLKIRQMTGKLISSNKSQKN